RVSCFLITRRRSSLPRPLPIPIAIAERPQHDTGGTTRRRWLPLLRVEYLPFLVSRGSDLEAMWALQRSGASSAATTNFSGAPPQLAVLPAAMRIEIQQRNLRAEDVRKGLGYEAILCWRENGRVYILDVTLNLNLGVHDLTSF
uniref:Uncharacterized protein n=1 Tax=Triticum urartu TaxID=4572 RepID=A0A8R7UQC9_TRIUA